MPTEKIILQEPSKSSKVINTILWVIAWSGNAIHIHACALLLIEKHVCNKIYNVGVKANSTSTPRYHITFRVE